MKFRAHDTFFIRKGWLNKGMRNVRIDPTVFMGSKGNPMDILGIGANMVKALRYWLQAVDLTVEPNTGKRKQSFTPFGEVVFNNDPYIEEMGTLWFLHYKLASNKNEATAWYFFYNEFKQNEFNKEDFVKQLSNYIMINGEEVSERSLEDDYNCIINTYVPRIKSSPEKVQPESNIDCPLGELRLIDISNRKEKLYKKSVPKKDTLHPLVLLAIILDQANGKEEIKISAIQNDVCNITKKEWVLNGDTVIYADWNSIKETLDYDFSTEKQFSYEGLSVDEAVKHLAKFASDIWQIHPFSEGNTRATAVFMIKYMKTFGFSVNNDAFEKYSWYFRNALVRANYNNLQKGVHSTTKFLEMFFSNLLLDMHYELKNRYMHIDYVDESASQSAKYETPKCQIGTLKCTLEELAVLDLIKTNPSVKQTELAEQTGKSVRSVKRIIDSLKEKQYIRRVDGKRYGKWEILA